MPGRKYKDEDILKVKAIYMHSRWVLGMSPESSKDAVKAQMDGKKSRMPDASLQMYCDDAEILESSIVTKRFGQAKIARLRKYIQRL